MIVLLVLPSRSLIPPVQSYTNPTPPWLSAAMPVPFAPPTFVPPCSAHPTFAQPNFNFAQPNFAPPYVAGSSFTPPYFASPASAQRNFASASFTNPAFSSSNDGAYAALPLYELNPRRQRDVVLAPIGRPVFQATGTLKRNAKARNDPIPPAMASRYAREKAGKFPADR